ncbi:chemotaxis protein CheW [Diaphorobacter ruginosibacter]|uniref:Chemotaxis protein CheW n=2 Tax=Diaphorobacter ruginosibacter TaxID=1715720 RepID=A0A7G9RNR8_9BURK|nr:chemotaxis protein CheW [Diaphorobacter ruginosibacter]QNN57243.1 chemotaxis protein CheW [Diaphorobacter ruginosibacter]
MTMGLPHGLDGTVEGREYLTFRIAQEEYGIDILKVREIRRYEAPTRIARTPAFIKGVVNLRGTIVPIVDLRMKLHQDCRPVYSEFTVVVILNLLDRVVGIVVDSVSDVLRLSDEQISDVPEFEGAIEVDSIEGLGTVGDRMLILLDIEKLMSNVDMGLVAADA